MTVCIDDRGTYGRVDLPLKEDGKKWNLNTAYMPEFCDMIIDMGKKGASWAQMVAACEVGKQTAEKWKARFPDWEYAVELAMTYSEAWFDKTALDNMCWVNSKGEPQFRSEVPHFEKFQNILSIFADKRIGLHPIRKVFKFLRKDLLHELLLFKAQWRQVPILLIVHLGADLMDGKP